MSALKNDLLLRALRGEKTERTPVWMMRQAGRYLPDYIKLREKYSFFERCMKPELATEITVMPVHQVGVDAAIIFSDILVVPQAMGLEVQLIEKTGPVLPDPIRTVEDMKRICVPDVNDKLGYVFDALRMTKQALDGAVPLIGFAGAPWTLLCYMVQGRGSKTFDGAKQFCYQQPAVAHQLLQMITDTTIIYLKEQVKAGADLVQIFDSWGGMLSPEDFEIFSLQYMRQIVAALKDVCPTILFAKGAWFALEEMAATGAHGLGIDWCIKPELARQFAGPNVTLQGNFDPAKLLAPIPEIEKAVKNMLKSFGGHRHIANLGHGILPNVPVDHAKAFVETVKAY
ncbi:MAG: uroporphyrinogen decarboxylase [Bacteroidetes bacterium]|uniref:uroporphyrinogen decarboxylase n=1 Tax=Chitinophaga TaxID=79328 RepID=UPI0009D3FC29|nr:MULTISPECIES: uroporphyrinogen decarboxylase [Chitinophaga]MBP1651418.1 uroporphyrinogen decarboxylase [Bacteroidota bacterium]OMP80225.1 uroporphyrinogen decarboxylase [[Flexibacter] sp. ATCC 35208]WPQ62391.1 uroporphyrinogen decarboxylase [Chitinophaga sancti]WPV66784.1 uroporphyrinogen decarboxylase [Chitinophaga sp. LS1]